MSRLPLLDPRMALGAPTVTSILDFIWHMWGCKHWTTTHSIIPRACHLVHANHHSSTLCLKGHITADIQLCHIFTRHPGCCWKALGINLWPEDQIQAIPALHDWAKGLGCSNPSKTDARTAGRLSVPFLFWILPQQGFAMIYSHSLGWYAFVIPKQDASGKVCWFQSSGALQEQSFPDTKNWSDRGDPIHSWQPRSPPLTLQRCSLRAAPGPSAPTDGALLAQNCRPWEQKQSVTSFEYPWKREKKHRHWAVQTSSC